jgi:hypothetical protein
MTTPSSPRALWPFLVGGGCVILVVVLVVVGGAVAVLRNAQSMRPTPSAPTAAPAGTASDPLPLGSTVTVKNDLGASVQVTVDGVEWNADEAVADANEFNSEPGEGKHYAVVTMTVSTDSEESHDALSGIDFAYRATNGASFRSSGAVTARSPYDAGEISDGESVVIEVALLLSEDDDHQGTFRIAPVMGDEAGVYVSAS